jgi:polysaccharide export outer membrane protein
MGEVTNPSTYTVATEKINILQALALAGDLTIYGKRDNVMLIRETAGVRKVARVNLNNKDVLESPYFYLQQNDIIYVEPHKSKGALASITRSNLSLALSFASVIAIILINL